jgi:TRAP-type mannitol/chloroaromatic compound transport system substrate-binding protein
MFRTFRVRRAETAGRLPVRPGRAQRSACEKAASERRGRRARASQLTGEVTDRNAARNDDKQRGDLHMSAVTKLLGTTASAAAFGLLVLPAPAEAIDRVRWQVPMAFASTLTALGDTMPWVADQLRAVSDGAIDLQVAEPGAVIPALSVFENVSTGAIDAGYSWMGYEIGQVPASALFGAMPFGLESIEFMAWMNFHGGRELLDETFEPFDVKAIPCGTISPEAAGWFREPVETLSDFQGIRFRAAGVAGEIVTEFGASVTMLPGGELYQALETGVLDGAEFSLPTVDEQLGFYQVAPYYYLPGWHQPSTNQFLYINLGVWEGLSEQTQALFEMACMAGNAYAIARAEALQGEVLQRFQEQGVTLSVFDDEILLELYAATERVMERRSSENEMFGRVYESMLEFQREHAAWKDLGYLPRDWMRENVFNGDEIAE